jgi:nitroreductase
VERDNQLTSRTKTVELERPTETVRSKVVLDAIRSRRSIGKVLPEPPSRDVIEQILDAAVWAPNHRLSEPWRFFVLTGDARVQLGDAMSRALVASGAQPAAAQSVRSKPLRAPVIIAVAVEPSDGPKIVEIEEVCAVAAATQNMLLAAHALDLAAIWRTGDPCFSPEVREFFNLSPRGQLLGFVYLGYPDTSLPSRERTPAAGLTTWLGWDD